VAAPKGEGTRIRIEVRKRNAFGKKPSVFFQVFINSTLCFGLD
jgi:hypothetical protein